MWDGQTAAKEKTCTYRQLVAWLKAFGTHENLHAARVEDLVMSRAVRCCMLAMGACTCKRNTSNESSQSSWASIYSDRLGPATHAGACARGYTALTKDGSHEWFRYRRSLFKEMCLSRPICTVA